MAVGAASLIQNQASQDVPVPFAHPQALEFVVSASSRAVFSPTDTTSIVESSTSKISSDASRGLMSGSAISIDSAEYDMVEKIQDNFLIKFEHEPLQKHEVNGAAEVVKADPDKFSRFIPFAITPEQFQAAVEDAESILNDKNLMANVRHRIALEKEKTLIEVPVVEEAMDSATEQSQGKADPATMNSSMKEVVDQDAAATAWRELEKEFPCVFCCDVLAAPVQVFCRMASDPTVNPCSHSFCGKCVTDYINAKVSDHPEDDIVCPVCQSVFLCSPTPALTYSLNMDNIIEKRAAKIFVPEQVEWYQRRKEYLDSRREQVNAALQPNPLEVPTVEPLPVQQRSFATWLAAFMILAFVVAARGH